MGIKGSSVACVALLHKTTKIVDVLTQAGSKMMTTFEAYANLSGQQFRIYVENTQLPCQSLRVLLGKVKTEII